MVNPPDMATMFFETRKKEKKLAEPKSIAKYAEIQKLVQLESSLINIEVVQRCFGPQRESHAVEFEGGITAKELKGGTTSKDESRIRTKIVWVVQKGRGKGFIELLGKFGEPTWQGTTCRLYQ
ncbi:hypothetical protein HAX54_039430, partial [Datura stramonium]|nr:hypothetical protein [Datura stramonium]